MICNCSRREFLARGLYGIGVGAGLPIFLSRTTAALTAQALQGTSFETHPERILVVLELSGGKDGRTAVVHGCGYDHPSLSHFSSMSYWHTGVPNAGEPLGWLGRLADDHLDPATRNQIVNIGTSQSLAVRSGRHSPLVFDDPARFRRDGTDAEPPVLAGFGGEHTPPSANATLEFRAATAQNAADSFDFVRQASAAYRTPVDDGIGNAFGGGLQRVAALIAAGMKTRLYYVSYQGNAFDTHVQQGDVHARLLMYTADAVRAFL